MPFQRYDAREFARYYRFRVIQTFWRSFRILSSLLRFFIGLQTDEILGNSEARRIRRAIHLRKMLTHLGPTFIKIGQALSTRPDLVRKDFLDELTLLQDQLPPFPTPQAFAIIEQQLGEPLEDIFKEISPKPVAAASLGQVYRGRLYTGEEVAVKVQRPHLVPKISLDLYILRKLVVWLEPFLPLNLGHDLSLIVDEFGGKLFEEIDYENEASNAERFAQNFQQYPSVKVPRIYRRYSSRTVLTLEWIEGVKLTATQCLLDANIKNDEMVRIGVISSLRQLLEFGFFHADPHPGNLFALPDGRMAYIDFGMMDQLDMGTKETLVDALVHLVNNDYSRLAQDFIKLGFLTPDIDITPIIPALETVFTDVIGVSVREFNFKTITDRFAELVYEYPFRLPAKFALIIRSLVTQEGVALCLNPDFRIVEVSYPYIAQRLLSEETPEFRRRLLEVLFKDGKFQWHRLENLIAIAQTDQSFDLIPTAGMGLQYLMSEEGKFLRRQLILALVEDDRLHTEEVQRLWSLIKEDLSPEKLWSAAVGALKSFSAETVSGWPPMIALMGSSN
ncbi:ABC1 kinase family protein [Lyngbya confervoides]|uniref:AarF/ABC1/UbiB kinase family protein n=1 Tax=Lyngbya confervoides BDU141951 TaxID=1574623 RepID=A0ABD4T1M7_9CYAN|nr:AarF/ABC1/UbiB kinase family protein [Lyngbya confervoides]MCM1982492.1 AarF/ABC1/UbiB kinase family protein [Lyngbya confervoides BDU141951]